jgi:hypothetical protein
MNTIKPTEALTPAQLITNQIAGLPDWRGALLARLRAVVKDAAPSLSEEWKWESAVWTQKGNVVSTCAFKDHVKINFFKGASLADPAGLFNTGQAAKASRSIDFWEGDEVPEAALKDIVRAAVAFDLSGSKQK